MRVTLQAQFCFWVTDYGTPVPDAGAYWETGSEVLPRSHPAPRPAARGYVQPTQLPTSGPTLPDAGLFYVFTELLLMAIWPLRFRVCYLF